MIINSRSTKSNREYANSNGFRILEKYIDEGESAKTADRLAFKEMIKRCQKDKSIDAVIVHKIDRFSRNNIDFYAYKAILKKEGVRLLSVTENIDENPSGEFIENVLVAMAQFYSRNLAEEVFRNFQAKSKNEITNLKMKIAENEAKMEALVDNLASRTITPDVYKKYNQKYRREIKNARDRLAILEKDYSSNFGFIDKCMILASTLSRLHKKFSFRQRKNLARALFKRIWVKG
ncbi:MAG: recombinase family protein [Thermoproteota archaeon]